MRATNSMVRITTSEGEIGALPRCGDFMGSAEAPKLFAKAPERPATAWSGTRNGALVWVNGNELTMRLLDSFWTSTLRWSLRSTVCLCSVVGAMTSGAETYYCSRAELQKMNARICRFLRVLLVGRAYDVSARRRWTDEEVLRHQRVAPMRVEIAVTHFVAAGNVD